MRLFLLIFFFIPFFCFAGTRYPYAVHTGDAVISQTNGGNTLANNDTLTVTGTTFNSITVTGVNGINIFLDFSGASMSHPKGSGLVQLQWDNISGVIFYGLSAPEWYGNIKFGPVFHDNKILNFRNINTGSNISDQPVFQVDWPYSSAMVFTGSKSQTYYNDTIQNSLFDGFRDVIPITIGTTWNSGTTPAQINRSLALDFVFISDTVQNVSRTVGSGGSVGAISGTGPNAKFINCFFNKIDGPGSANASHNESILWYGYITVDGGGQTNSYASMVRNLPLQWNGLAGYSGNDINHTRIQNTLVKHQLSYSAHEITSQGAGTRTSNGFSFRRAEIIHNTVDSTTGLSYNPPPSGSRYQGKIVDLVSLDSATIDGNIIFRPEQDYASVPYSTDSAAHNGYFYSEIGSATTHLTLGTNFSSRYSTPYLVDSTFYVPISSTGPLNGGVASYPGYTVDRYNVAVTTYKGAAAFTGGGSVPGCATNSSPSNGSTIGTPTTATLVWGSVATATSYDVYIGGVLITNTGSTSYGASGLVASTSYSWYIVPKNGNGDAVGCSGNATTFTTSAAGTGYTVGVRKPVRSKVIKTH